MIGQVDARWIGHILNRNYRIDSLLGKGGQATIFKGTDLLLDEKIAIKQFHKKGDESQLERFKREARHQMKLVHQNIVGTRAIIEEDDEYFIVMEYIDGTDLGHLISVTDDLPRLPLYKIKTIFSEVLDALGHAHSKDIIHRDIKPPNIMLTQDYKVKLADFGMARQLQDQRLTVEGQVLGTPAYTAPEILQGASTLDPRCDIYSVGVSLYETVCGTTPFLNPGEALAPFELLGRHLFMEPESPLSRGAPISKALDQVIMKSITKDPENRFQDCASFRSALLESMDEDKTIIYQIPEEDDGGTHDTRIIQRPDFDVTTEQGPDDEWTGVATRHEMQAVQHFVEEEDTDSGADEEDDEHRETVIIEGAAHSEFLTEFNDDPVKIPSRPTQRSGAGRFLAFVGVVLLIVGLVMLRPDKIFFGVTSTSNSDAAPTPSRPIAPSTGTRKRLPVRFAGLVPMVKVPAGYFVQGKNTNNMSSTFRPKHAVYLDTFWIDQFEVTVWQFRRCVKKGFCVNNGEIKLSTQTNKKAPVTHVSWSDALSFCRWMGKTLPTEAQWEKAARGRTKMLLERPRSLREVDADNYPWGDAPPSCEHANRCRCSGGPLPVGAGLRAKGRSAYGVYDLSGNVWEWTLDCFVRNAYRRQLRKKNPVMSYDPKAPRLPDGNRRECPTRVLRGGSWKCANRWGLYSYTRRGDFYRLNLPDVGFRCAYNPPKK